MTGEFFMWATVGIAVCIMATVGIALGILVYFMLGELHAYRRAREILKRLK